MEQPISIDDNVLFELSRNPTKTVCGEVAGVAFNARVGIPDYVSRISEFYDDSDLPNPRVLSKELDIPDIFDQFGLICEFETPLEAFMYDDDMVLDAGVREIVRQFGPVILRNVYMNKDNRAQGHKARFEQLNFHYDRSSGQPEQHSLYVKDPFDPDQKGPRGASTVFISNAVACLQYARENEIKRVDESCLKPHYILYGSEAIKPALGNVVLEQAWEAPDGVGEIIVIDNRTVFHASYYKSMHKGWRIGVRYLK